MSDDTTDDTTDDGGQAPKLNATQRVAAALLELGEPQLSPETRADLRELLDAPSKPADSGAQFVTRAELHDAIDAATTPAKSTAKSTPAK